MDPVRKQANAQESSGQLPANASQPIGRTGCECLLGAALGWFHRMFSMASKHWQRQFAFQFSGTRLATCSPCVCVGGEGGKGEVHAGARMCVCVCVRARACVHTHACVRACVRPCARARVRVYNGMPLYVCCGLPPSLFISYSHPPSRNPPSSPPLPGTVFAHTGREQTLI